MKTLKNIFAALFLITFATVNVNAQNEATVSEVKAAATIIAPISISLENDGLNFGTIIKPTSQIEVTIDPTGLRSSGNDELLLDQLSSFFAASFEVTGEPLASYSIATISDVTLTDGTNNMTVSNFTNNATTSLDSSGEETFGLGATLTVSANQDAGEYEGEFAVTVAYE